MEKLKSKLKLKTEQRKYQEEKLTCKRCGSSYILYKKSTNQYWCRKCGHTWNNQNENFNKSE